MHVPQCCITGNTNGSRDREGFNTSVIPKWPSVDLLELPPQTVDVQRHNSDVSGCAGYSGTHQSPTKWFFGIMNLHAPLSLYEVAVYNLQQIAWGTWFHELPYRSFAPATHRRLPFPRPVDDPPLPTSWIRLCSPM